MAYPADATGYEKEPLMKRIPQSSENMPVPQSVLAPRPVPTRVEARVRQREGSLQRVAEPLAGDRETWCRSIQEALGTTSPHFAEACLQRLIGACTLPNEPVTRSTGLSAALALIQSLAPENEVQAALAVDAACLHAAAANVLDRLGPGGGDRRLVMLTTAAARLERAFHSALETYYRIKRGNTQVIRVEKLEVQAGGQALVGALQRT